MRIRRNLLSPLLSGFALVFLIFSSANAENWTRFRGSDGSGISEKSAPVQWSPEENLKWKAKLPGAGVSCPIIVGDKVFVTCYSGYGVDRRNAGKVEDLKRHVVCLDRNSGDIVWEKTIEPVLPEDSYTGMGVPEHGYASHTPVSDGEHVYAFLGKAGVYAYDLDGKQLWHADVGKGSDRRRWGSASSPVLYEDILIVPAIAESSSMVGLNKKTGDQIWKEESGSLESSWSTPLLVKVKDKKTDLVMPMGGEVWGLNPATGKLRWYCTNIPGDSFYTSVTEKDGVIFGSVGGRSGGGSFAIKVGGKGDVTKSHMTWTNGDQSSYATPVLHDGKMFIASRGIATSMKIDDGKQVAKVRLSGSEGGSERGSENAGGGGSRFGGRGGGGGGSDYSSPVIAGDNLYYVKRNGETFVFSAAGDDLEQLAVNRVTSDDENFSASPAVCDGQIFLRSDKHLYCIEQKAEESAKEKTAEKKE